MLIPVQDLGAHLNELRPELDGEVIVDLKLLVNLVLHDVKLRPLKGKHAGEVLPAHLHLHAQYLHRPDSALGDGLHKVGEIGERRSRAVQAQADGVGQMCGLALQSGMRVEG